MSCPKTEHLLKEYFSDDLGSIARQEMESHLSSCQSCNQELESLLLAHASLERWQDEQPPHWDRGIELFRREHRSTERAGGMFDIWRWLPTAVSFAMLGMVMLNTSFMVNDQGFSVSFGGSQGNASAIESRLMTFEENQQASLAELITRIENRQDANNVQLMQAVFDQTQQTTAANLERIYGFFEEQRLQDLENMRVGYQELVNNDYETIRSLEQLAQYVSFSEEIR